MTIGRGHWSERKASVGHSGDGGGGQKKRAAGRGRGALREMSGKIGEVRVQFGLRRMVMCRGWW